MAVVMAVVAVAAGVGVVQAQLLTGSRLGYGDLVVDRAAAAGWLHGDPVYAMGFGPGRLPFPIRRSRWPRSGGCRCWVRAPRGP